MQTWKLIAHHSDTELALRWFCSDSIIAVGWGRVGDLSTLAPAGPVDITRLVKTAYPELKNSHLGGPSLWHFFHDMQREDLVIVTDRTRRCLVMRVEGDYTYSAEPSPVEPGDYQHQRRAVRISADPDLLWSKCGRKVLAGENSRWTVARCGGASDG